MTNEERRAIEQAVRDYFDSWFDGDPQRMASILHPQLAKRRAAGNVLPSKSTRSGKPTTELATDADLLAFYAPAAMVGYFDELSAALARGEADPEVLTQIADRYGMEVVGPVPEGYL